MNIIWDLPDDPKGNVQHLAEHGVTEEEAEEVLLNRRNPQTISRTSGNRLTFGYTSLRLDAIWRYYGRRYSTIR
ncbi:MAG TPA: hypothetical protein VNH11_07170 [Pirellulales bacterium]|nr:hypothetical protein [Pirellulales bacterium]